AALGGMPFASLACGSLLCVFCPGAHRHRAGIKTTVPNAEEIRIAHNLAYSQAGLVTSIDGGVLNRFWGTHPLAYARGSLNLAKSTRLLPSRDRQGAFSVRNPKTGKHPRWRRCPFWLSVTPSGKNICAPISISCRFCPPPHASPYVIVKSERALRSLAAAPMEKRCAALHRQRPGPKSRPPVMLAPGAPPTACRAPP